MFLRGYTRGYGWRPEPLAPYTVRERRGPGHRTDTVTRSLRYAIERRDLLRRTRRPAYVVDATGRRVEVERF